MFNKTNKLFKSICLLVVVAFMAASLPIPAYSAGLNLPAPTQFVPLSNNYSFPVLKGLKFDPNSPFSMQFIIDGADKKKITQKDIAPLINYFLAALAIPEEDIWVNLSPYEKNRITSNDLAQTDLGKDLLSQDYILKQLTSSLTYPESDTGKVYWDKIYKDVAKIAGTTNIPINTFSKVWIVPDQAEVYENETTALVTKASLKVMTDEDYLALEKNIVGEGLASSRNNQITNNGQTQGSVPTQTKQINKIALESFKQTILPKINQDVNKGKNFSRLRQIYHSIILGAWFKKKFKQSIYKHYIDQGKLAGIDIKDKNAKDKIYNLYVQAFKKGVYNYIKTEPSQGSKANGQKPVRRRYHSGGFNLNTSSTLKVNTVYHGISVSNFYLAGGGFESKWVVPITQSQASSSLRANEEVISDKKRMGELLETRERLLKDENMSAGDFTRTLRSIDEEIEYYRRKNEEEEAFLKSSSSMDTNNLSERGSIKSLSKGRGVISGNVRYFEHYFNEEKREELRRRFGRNVKVEQAVLLDEKGNISRIGVYQDLKKENLLVNGASSYASFDYYPDKELYEQLDPSIAFSFGVTPIAKDRLNQTIKTIKTKKSSSALSLEEALDITKDTLDFFKEKRVKHWINVHSKKVVSETRSARTKIVIDDTATEISVLLSGLRKNPMGGVFKVKDAVKWPIEWTHTTQEDTVTITVPPNTSVKDSLKVISENKEINDTFGKEKMEELKQKLTPFVNTQAKRRKASGSLTFYTLERIGDHSGVINETITLLSGNELETVEAALKTSEITDKKEKNVTYYITIFDDRTTVNLQRLFLQLWKGTGRTNSATAQVNIHIYKNKIGIQDSSLPSHGYFFDVPENTTIELIINREKNIFELFIDGINNELAQKINKKIKEHTPYIKVTNKSSSAIVKEINDTIEYIRTAIGIMIPLIEKNMLRDDAIRGQKDLINSKISQIKALTDSIQQPKVKEILNQLDQVAETVRTLDLNNFWPSLQTIDTALKAITTQTESIKETSASSALFQKVATEKWQGGGIAMEGMDGRIQAVPALLRQGFEGQASSPINIPVGFNPANFGGLKWHFGFMTEIKNSNELEKVLGIIRKPEEKELSHLP